MAAITWQGVVTGLAIGVPAGVALGILILGLCRAAAIGDGGEG